MEILFKQGDKVVLKTGGEVMTIVKHLTNIASVFSDRLKENKKGVELEKIPMVLCEWHEDGIRKQGNFMESEIVLSEKFN